MSRKNGTTSSGKRLRQLEIRKSKKYPDKTISNILTQLPIATKKVIKMEATKLLPGKWTVEKLAMNGLSTKLSKSRPTLMLRIKTSATWQKPLTVETTYLEWLPKDMLDYWIDAYVINHSFSCAYPHLSLFSLCTKLLSLWGLLTVALYFYIFIYSIWFWLI